MSAERWGDQPVPVPLTLRSPHAVIASVEFWSTLQLRPGGAVGRGWMRVPAGMLLDDRNEIYTRYRDKFRRPTSEERERAE